MALFYQRKWLLIRLPIAVVALATASWLWLFVYPIPESRVTITTAGLNGAYYKLALKYAQSFAKHGITLEVQASDGSIENLQRLRAVTNQSDLALMQGGFGFLGNSNERQELSRVQTLANVDTEILWLFSRVKDITSLNQLKGLRIAVGANGSGSRKVALKLLEQARIDPKDVVLSPLMGPDSAEALKLGAVDAVFFVAPADSFTLPAMINVPGIHLANLSKSLAIVERNPYLESTLLAKDSLKAGLPYKDVALLTTSASLVARESLNPALKRLAIAVAMDVHTYGGLLYRAGDFPSLRRIDFPIATDARKTLLQGLPLHERLLPFWWAQVLERLLYIVLPIALLALVLMLKIPSFLRWTIESRLNRWYGELKFIENDLNQKSMSGIDLTRFLSSLNTLDKSLRAFRSPKDLMARTYTLHQHVEFVRQRVYKLRGR